VVKPAVVVGQQGIPEQVLEVGYLLHTMLRQVQLAAVEVED
jgi:hypothetical protein